MFTMIPASVHTSGSGPAYNAHRYWRINCTATNGLSAFLLAQGKSGFKNTPGGSFDAVSVVTASSQAFESASGFFTVGARWSTTFSGLEWISADLGSAQAVAQLVMIGNSSFPDRTMADFTVQWSDDDATWNTSATFTGQALTSDIAYTFTVGDPV